MSNPDSVIVRKNVTKSEGVNAVSGDDKFSDSMVFRELDLNTMSYLDNSNNMNFHGSRKHI
jgi:hypothetical protein